LVIQRKRKRNKNVIFIYFFFFSFKYYITISLLQLFDIITLENLGVFTEIVKRKYGRRPPFVFETMTAQSCAYESAKRRNGEN
jgi:hypothetical protein